MKFVVQYLEFTDFIVDEKIHSVFIAVSRKQEGANVQLVQQNRHQTQSGAQLATRFRSKFLWIVYNELAEMLCCTPSVDNKKLLFHLKAVHSILENYIVSPVLERV